MTRPHYQLVWMAPQIPVLLELIETSSPLKYKDFWEKFDTWPESFGRKWRNWKINVVPTASTLLEVITVAKKNGWLNSDPIPPEVAELVTFLEQDLYKSRASEPSDEIMDHELRRLRRQVERRRKLLMDAEIELEGHLNTRKLHGKKLVRR